MLEHTDKIEGFELQTADGRIEVNPSLPIIKIIPSKGRKVYLTGPSARLVVDFISMLLMSDDLTTTPDTWTVPGDCSCNFEGGNGDRLPYFA